MKSSNEDQSKEYEKIDIDGGGTKQQKRDGLIWTFDPDDCILNDICPALRTFVFSKTPILLMGLMTIGWMTLFLWGLIDQIQIKPADGHKIIQRKEEHEYLEETLGVGIGMLIPSIAWCICVILSINRKVFHLVIRSPDIWVNTIGAVTFSCYNVIFWWRYIMWENNKTGKVAVSVLVINSILCLTIIVLSMVILSSIDGLPHFNRWSRLYAGIFTGLFLFSGSWLYELLDMHVKDFELSLFKFDVEISITTGLISSMRALAGLMARQGLTAYLNQDRCVALSHQPKLQWTGDVSAKIEPMDEDEDSSYSLMEDNATIQMEVKK